jgi:uncharacterized protein
MRSQGRPFSVVLHGGEPLLLGALKLGSLFGRLRSELGEVCGISVQTNGVLISDEIVDVCADYNVTISVSLDGPAAVHDRFRTDLVGRPTHARVLEGIRTLKAHGEGSRLFSGVLAVVDPSTDAISIYNYFTELGVPSVDFLYRDGNHDHLPYGKASFHSTEYGRWMSQILDCYVADPTPFRIRMLDDMMKLLMGGCGVKEGVGLTDFGILVIDTNGSIKKNDTLKSSAPGDAFAENWKSGSGELARVATSNDFEAYHRAQRPSSVVCRSCPLLDICGGGMLTHRFSSAAGYDNPTVFCLDQKLLISRMLEHLAMHAIPAAA